MAKSTTGRSKFKIQRAIGAELPGLGKPGALDRRPYGPGVHGNKRKKVSDFAVRLKEKQKLLFHYALREKQLVKQVKLSKRDKSRAWMDSLIINLESRLVNVIFRMNFAPSMAAAAQMISHGQITVNGKRVKVGGFVVKKGDIVSLSEKGHNNQLFKQAQDSPRLPAVPACYKIDMVGGAVQGTKIDDPLSTDIPFEFDKQLVTEYYWKVKN